MSAVLTQVARTESEVLDAYSAIVTSLAEIVVPSVAAIGGVRGHQGGAGSAVVLSADGYLLTSSHVVPGDARGTASFADGREAPFELVGRDALWDLEVLRGAPRPPTGPAR